jgi:Mn2+/Fe2+ NRAMP family transporter
VRKLEGFFAFLIMIMAVTFILNMFKADLDFKEIMYGTFVPTIPSGAL